MNHRSPNLNSDHILTLSDSQELTQATDASIHDPGLQARITELKKTLAGERVRVDLIVAQQLGAENERMRQELERDAVIREQHQEMMKRAPKKEQGERKGHEPRKIQRNWWREKVERVREREKEREKERERERTWYGQMKRYKRERGEGEGGR